MLLRYGSEDTYRLPPQLAAELGAAMEDIHAHLMITMCDLQARQDTKRTWLYEQLPPSARLRCDTRLCRDFLITLATLAFKAFGPIPMPISCRAEELLLVWAVDEVEAMREVAGEGFEEKIDFLGEVIGDFDFEFMYDPAVDGIDRMDKMAELDIGPFSVDEWFTPYRLPRAATNPLTWPEEIAYTYENWNRFGSQEDSTR